MLKVLLGQFPMQLFVDPKPKAVLEQFSTDIKIIGDYIKHRFKLEKKMVEYALFLVKILFRSDRNEWAVRYDYLLPENIPCRIDF